MLTSGNLFMLLLAYTSFRKRVVYLRKRLVLAMRTLPGDEHQSQAEEADQIHWRLIAEILGNIDQPQAGGLDYEWYDEKTVAPRPAAQDENGDSEQAEI